MASKKKTVIFFLLIFASLLSVFFYLKNSDKKKEPISEIIEKDEVIYSSNIIKDVNYITRDTDGNEYIINALQGEIDYAQSNIIFLEEVNAIIRLKDLTIIRITSDFGKYNSENFDTIFSKNVLINYLENNIKGEYLDFSLERNKMIISKNVVYSNLENILKADVLEMNLKTKDTKIFMYETNKKVNIKSKNFYGNN